MQYEAIDFRVENHKRENEIKIKCNIPSNEKKIMRQNNSKSVDSRVVDNDDALSCIQ